MLFRSIDPKFIGPDGRANPQYLKVPTEPGVMGERIILSGTANWNLDASLAKDLDLPGRANMRLHITATNVLNHPIFGAPDWNDFPNISSTTFGQTTNPINGARQMYIRAEFTF